jgi:micrococcal nuclease
MTAGRSRAARSPCIPSPPAGVGQDPIPAAVRAAGADPLYAGQPGHSRKLDRDGDLVACES